MFVSTDGVVKEGRPLEPGTSWLAVGDLTDCANLAHTNRYRRRNEDIQVDKEFILLHNFLTKWTRLFTFGYKSKDCNIVVGRGTVLLTTQFLQHS